MVAAVAALARDLVKDSARAAVMAVDDRESPSLQVVSEVLAALVGGTAEGAVVAMAEVAWVVA